jgi:transcriptional regulator with XRE-family HTH domain
MDVKVHREAAGLSQRQLAAKMGVSPSLVAAWEKGDRKLNAAQEALLTVVLDPEMPEPTPTQLSKHKPRPGVRIARICTQCQRRVFSDPKWQCPEHPGKTIAQTNRPYLGQPTGGAA